MFLKLLNPPPLLRGFPKAQSLELNMDTRSNQLLQNNHLYPAERQPKVGPLELPPVPKMAILRKAKNTEMHKEDQQAADGPSSLGATSKEGAHPQLSSGSNPSLLVDKTNSAGDGLKTAHTTSGENEESRADDISQKVKLEDLLDILKDTRSAFFTPDSPTDEPIIVLDESKEEVDAEKNKDTDDTSVPPPPYLKLAQIQELMTQVYLLQSQKEELEQAKAKSKAEVASMKAKPSYLDINQLTKLLVTSLKPELSKLLVLHGFASCLPTKLKELPSKITEISGKIKELKQHVRDIELELHKDLLEIPTKLETFTSTIFMDNASGATNMHVPSAGQAAASPAGTNLKDELIDLLGKDVMT
ncbi:hypothetical protein Tco_1461182 [Tanacetum coccineum]